MKKFALFVSLLFVTCFTYAKETSDLLNPLLVNSVVDVLIKIFSLPIIWVLFIVIAITISIYRFTKK